jgi:FkbM family methyltransferase
MLKLYNFGEMTGYESIVQFSDWETDEVLFKKELLKVKRGWTIIDVGSEYGYYAIKAGQLVGNEGTVMAIEPHPETFGLLEMNVRLHNLDRRIILVRKAVGNKTGRVKLHETISPGGSSLLSRSVFRLNKDRLLWWLEFAKNGSIFKVFRKKYATAKHEVPVETLDYLAKDYGLKKIDLIKIDVEGAEMDVLTGSRGILESHKLILLVEVHFGCDWKPETLYNFLKKHGYDLIIEKRAHKSLVVACSRA